MYKQEFLGKTLYIQEPCKRNLFYKIDDDLDNRIIDNFYLAFPYVLFLYNNQNLHVVATLKKPKLNSKIYHLKLGNSYFEDTSFLFKRFYVSKSVFRVCLEGFNLNENAEDAIDLYWQSYFNLHEDSECLKHIKQWEKFTERGRIPNSFWEKPQQINKDFHANACLTAQTVEEFIRYACLDEYQLSELLKDKKFRQYIKRKYDNV